MTDAAKVLGAVAEYQEAKLGLDVLSITCGKERDECLRDQQAPGVRDRLIDIEERLGHTIKEVGVLRYKAQKAREQYLAAVEMSED